MVECVTCLPPFMHKMMAWNIPNYLYLFVSSTVCVCLCAFTHAVYLIIHPLLTFASTSCLVSTPGGILFAGSLQPAGVQETHKMSLGTSSRP